MNRVGKKIFCHYQRMLHEAWNDYENATLDIHDWMKICSSFYSNKWYLKVIFVIGLRYFGLLDILVLDLRYFGANLRYFRPIPVLLAHLSLFWYRPVLVSSSTDAIILVELTVPWEDRLQYSNALKADKYADLSMDLEAKGYRTDLFPIEVGARGVVGRSTYAFLAKIGLSSRERKKAMTRMSEAAEAASFWIWHMRSQKKS